MDDAMTEKLKELFESYTGTEALSLKELPASGSNRRYFRISGGYTSLIGVLGTSVEENKAFIALDKHFISKGIKVPKIFAVSEDFMYYIQEDLGDAMLYDLVKQGRESGDYSSSEKELLCRVIAKLPEIQFTGAENLDFSVCYQESAFNARTVLFDLNYFKYCFLKATGLEFNEALLQDDFEKFKDDLVRDCANTFMYRDFQARNVMVKDNEIYFIDFQGGRKGPIYYDIASFVWQASARYPEGLRDDLVKTYLTVLKGYIQVDEKYFYERLRLFVLFRTLQVLGAYGFRGYFEKKPHFIASVPYALGNLRKLLLKPFESYPYLSALLLKLANLPELNSVASDTRLEVKIYSFAYKKGIPADTTGNGGGYVFDCRSINNPGKFEYYRPFTGMDAEVIKFLEDDGEVIKFLSNVYSLVDAHAKRFIERKFTNLQVCFGCTGGQHRSVYCAEHLASYLASKFDLKVILIHRELGIERII